MTGKWRTWLLIAAVSWGGAAEGVESGAVVRLEVRGDPPGLSESLQREARAAIDRGLRWLLAQQSPTGSWSNAQYPALTALPLWALAKAGMADSPAAQRAVDFLLSCAHENGAIYRAPDRPGGGGGLPNYNTAISMVALHLSGDPRATPVVLRARRYLARTQHLGGDVYYGGMGYDAESGRPYADLSNSYIAYEAMRMTESAEDLRRDGGPRADLNWEAARAFIQRTQNDARFNPAPWATDDPADRGGFVYHPEQTRAGTTTNAAGVVKFRSMRGMTYAGLLSYIYADVDRTDPRVEATVNWIVRNWSLDANNPRAPGEGKTATQDDREGLFYMYNVMAKGLAAYGQDVFRPPNAPPFNWRVELIQRLLALQKTDPATGLGYWVNDVGRYWESDPVLVTSYALIALQVALGTDPATGAWRPLPAGSSR
ncbi:MAG: terpene cyclase/mutase family protein [Kiritimatiellae bacterium]|nr:terpene cyclase/mutase family protein [Kiritimatiellia bacterium]